MERDECGWFSSKQTIKRAVSKEFQSWLRKVRSRAIPAKARAASIAAAILKTIRNAPQKPEKREGSILVRIPVKPPTDSGVIPPGAPGLAGYRM